MTSELFSAELAVPKAGFQWCDAGYVDVDPDFDGDVVRVAGYLLRTDRYLIPADQFPVEDKTYELFTEHPGLFRTFASLRATENEILNFGNKFGWLGFPTIIVDAENLPEREESDDDPIWEEVLEGWHIYQRDGSRPHPEFYGESLGQWTARIGEMRDAIRIWEPLRAKKPNRSNRPERHSSTSDDVAPGWTLLRGVVNFHLRYRGAPQLTDGRSGPQLQFQTSKLLESLWLQFARAVEGDKDYDRCPRCGNYFEIGPSAGRKGKVYCSDACRMAAHRKRKAEQT